MKRSFFKSFFNSKGKKVEQKPVTQQSFPENSVHHLIIIDESGSMGCIRSQVVSGCNETLQTIRQMAEKEPEQQHYVSIYFFDTDLQQSRYVIQDELIDKVNDLRNIDYHPNGYTPLYDAMGTTITDLRRKIGKTETLVMVTVITDGYENSSQEYNLSDIYKLVGKLKKNGWIFAFMGANVDARSMADELNIGNSMQFEQTEEGVETMFKRSDRGMACCCSAFFTEAKELPKEERESFFKKMNETLFDEDI